jgi:hypothetical protein
VSDETKFDDAALYEIDGAIRCLPADLQMVLGGIARETQREQTTATILAALIVRGAPLEADHLAMTSVTMADALRAELGRKP